MLITSQAVAEENNLVKPEVVPNDFLASMGINKPEDLEVDNRLVFYLTPFSDDYWQTFLAVKEACSEIGLQVVRGDEQFIAGDILPIVVRQIVKARFVIANITGRNPNVMYELGLTHAIGKPTILLAENLTDVPFDLNHKRIILFENESDLKQRLLRTIAALSVS